MFANDGIFWHVFGPLNKSMRNNKLWCWLVILVAVFGATGAFAGESDINIPDLGNVKFAGLGGIAGSTLM